uniref:Uncharacterized protein n=1 Tax=Spironucleus salmonicida TaxID=348837 RepID=V6LQ85_9EUKA|eukprot:EST46740.1 Hypothetical protein SS50377_13256 [Spironucleus salmonicida]
MGPLRPWQKRLYSSLGRVFWSESRRFPVQQGSNRAQEGSFCVMRGYTFAGDGLAAGVLRELDLRLDDYPGGGQALRDRNRLELSHTLRLVNVQRRLHVAGQRGPVSEVQGHFRRSEYLAICYTIIVKGQKSFQVLYMLSKYGVGAQLMEVPLWKTKKSDDSFELLQELNKASLTSSNILPSCTIFSPRAESVSQQPILRRWAFYVIMSIRRNQILQSPRIFYHWPPTILYDNIQHP